INYAIILAEQLGHTYVGSEHLLLGLLREGTGVAAAILSQKGVAAEQINQIIIQTVGRGVLSVLSPAEFSNNLKRILENSALECRAMGLLLAGTEHLLLGLCSQTSCFAVHCLSGTGVDRGVVARMIAEAISTEPREEVRNRPAANPPMPPPTPRAPRSSSVRTPTLDKYGRDLTDMAAAGRLSGGQKLHRRLHRFIISR
ncbi:MAG: Clp protease N-terminal domain-containing protein, partial [Angelakisella sp.]